MPGVIFLIVIPTASFERTLPVRQRPTQMNIPASDTDSPDGHNAVRLEVELRTKKMPPAHHQFRQAEAATVRRPNARGVNNDDNTAPPTYESHHQQNQPAGGGACMEDVRWQTPIRIKSNLSLNINYPRSCCSSCCSNWTSSMWCGRRPRVACTIT